jgi:hypothetical protein
MSIRLALLVMDTAGDLLTSTPTLIIASMCLLADGSKIAPDRHDLTTTLQLSLPKVTMRMELFIQGGYRNKSNFA